MSPVIELCISTRMEFELPDDIQALKKTVRDFCEKHVKDKAREWDHHEKFPR